MSVRLPSGAGYAPQVDREHRWLPFLDRHLQTPIPTPLAKGAPSRQFPWAWSIYRWLDGTPLEEAPTVDLDNLAVDVATFLRALQSIPTPTDAPEPEQSNGFRGAPFDRYLAEGQAAVRLLDESVQQQARNWLHQATESSWSSAPVWVHGDAVPGNLLLDDGRLCGVIDFGCMAVGDPACDLTMAWTIFDPHSRRIFRDHVGHDLETWSRARGWAVWKAAITLHSDPPPTAKSQLARRTLTELWSRES
jgi:aminoglycoside phosphotransferase (APT) family kinase protein